MQSLDIPASWQPGTPDGPRLELLPLEEEALAFLVPLSEDYPGIEQWFRTRVVPGLRGGTRKLMPVVRDDALVGLGIAKLEPDERKICTVRVAPTHAGRGMGVRIFDGLLRWLDVDRPHLTVSTQKLPAFERIFDYYGFNITSAHEGLYVPHTCELGYNEPQSLIEPEQIRKLKTRSAGAERQSRHPGQKDR